MAKRVWAGDIALDIDLPGQKLEALQIFSTQHSCLLPTSSHLSFLALLDTTRLPLHLIAGPVLDVYTEKEESERWLSNILLGGLEKGTLDDGTIRSRHVPGIQSEVGILVQVDSASQEDASKPRITELLLYAASTTFRHTGDSGILTPPASSSPSLGNSEHYPYPEDQAQTLHVYALPLSSDLRYVPPTAPPTPLTFAGPAQENEATFLPDPDFSEIHNPRKRQRLDTLFDDATQQNKRAKSKGGQIVSKIMSTSSTTSPVISPADPERKEPEMLVRKRPKSAALNQSLSRSHSVGSMRDIEDSRPQSRSGPLARTQRSSLHRVTSLSRLDSTSPLQSPVPECVPWNETEQQNKTALSRIVMAGMRMYGLQQRKKRAHTRTGSDLANPSAEKEGAEKAPEEDEYKLVYHQTYKSAAFVMRRQMTKEVLGQDFMRDQVDRLLAIFCVDPRESAATVDHGFGQSNTGGLFDTPSTEAMKKTEYFDSNAALLAQEH